MTVDSGFLNRLRSRGEEVLTQVSAELSSNPRFMQAMAGAMRGKEKLDEAVARVLRQMNVPSRSELKRALARIDALEREVSGAEGEGAGQGPGAAAPDGAESRPPRRASRDAWRGSRITGTASFLGGRLLRRLVAAHGPDAVLAVDITPPPTTLHGVRHRMVDLTLPGADRRLVEVFREEEVDTVVHAAFFTTPRRDSAYAHELESIGTLHLAAAAAAAGVRHLLLRSFTGRLRRARAEPELPDRGARPDADSRLGWVRDKVEAEEHAFSFSRRYPGLGVTVLRFATLLGPGVHTFYTRLLSKRVVPVVLGYDPLVQLLHPDDALEAALLALEKGPSGVVNVVPRATITLLTALHLADKVIGAGAAPRGLPARGAVVGARAWARRRAASSTTRASRSSRTARRRARGWASTARYSSREALEAYLAYRYPEVARRASAVRADGRERGPRGGGVSVQPKVVPIAGRRARPKRRRRKRRAIRRCGAGWPSSSSSSSTCGEPRPGTACWSRWRAP